jgi:hypothetical protein
MNYFEKTELDTVYVIQLCDFLDVFPYVASETTRNLQEIKRRYESNDMYSGSKHGLVAFKTILFSLCHCFFKI